MKLFWNLSAALLSLSASAEAGVINGGGGGAYVCRDAEGAVVQARLVDLWESEHTPFQWPGGQKMIPMVYRDDISAEEQFAAAMKKLAAVDPGFADAVTKEKNEIWANKHVLDEDVEIAVPSDLKAVYFPKGCPIEGMMFYNGESNQLDVQNEIFSKLRTKTDVAAAWTHEAIYKLARFTAFAYHPESTRTRRLVACLYSSDQGCLSNGQSEAVVPKDRVLWVCSYAGETLTIYPLEKLATLDELVKFGHAQSNNSVKFNVVGTKMDGLNLNYNPVEHISMEVDGGGGSYGLLANGALSPYHFSVSLGAEPKFNSKDGITMEYRGYGTQGSGLYVQQVPNGHTFSGFPKMNCTIILP